MAWPTTAVATGELITAAQLNLLPIRIADSTVIGSAAASIDFTSIPSVYAHLLAIVYGRGDTGATSTILRCDVNNDTGSNYDQQYLTGFGSTVVAGESLATNQGMMLGLMPAASATAGRFGASISFFPNYANSANQKTAVSLDGRMIGTATGEGRVTINLNQWRATSAISRLTFKALAGNLDVGTRVTLYGMPA